MSNQGDAKKSEGVNFSSSTRVAALALAVDELIGKIDKRHKQQEDDVDELCKFYSTQFDEDNKKFEQYYGIPLPPREHNEPLFEFHKKMGKRKRSRVQITTIRQQRQQYEDSLKKRKNNDSALQQQTQPRELPFGSEAYRKDPIDPTALLGKPKTLWDLWNEYLYGLDGHKPARDFTRVERGRIKTQYCRRKRFWDLMIKLIEAGYSESEAMNLVETAYEYRKEKGKSVTYITGSLRFAKEKGYHPKIMKALQNKPKQASQQQEKQTLALEEQTLQQRTPQQQEKQAQGLEEQTPEQRTPQQQEKQAQTLEEQTPKQQTPQQQEKQAQALEEQTPKQQTPQQQERQAEALEEQKPKQQTPQQQEKQAQALEEETPKQQTPQQQEKQAQALEEEKPKQQTPQQQTLEQHSPQQQATQQEAVEDNKLQATEENEEDTTQDNEQRTPHGSKERKIKSSRVFESTAVLGRPRTLLELWHEYIYGLDGNKAAKDFSRGERGKNKANYSRRNNFWSLMKKLMSVGHNELTAIHLIEESYGRDLGVTELLNELRNGKKAGYHPNIADCV